MKQGWIKIHRKLLECDIWDYDEPYTRRDAWIELLLLANHSDKDIIFDGHKTVVKRGQYLTSVRKLATRWQWGKDKTLSFLRLLEECGMIIKESDSRRTLLTIVNYEVYQAKDDDDQTVTRQLADSEQTVSRHSPATNKNVKNDKNEKNDKYIPSFDEFWKTYPRKNDKAKAYKCYKARLNDGYTEEQLLTACKNYAEECEKNRTEQKYIKHGATFLSVNEPFLDYLKGDEDGRGDTEHIKSDKERREEEIDRYLRSDEYLNGEDESPFDMPFV